MADLTTAQLVDLLAENVEQIDALQRDRGAEVTATAAPGGGWSMVQVLAHLRSCADVWGGAIGEILHDDEVTFKDVEPQAWAAETDYDALGWEPSWNLYRRDRAELLDRLRELDEVQWERRATVTRDDGGEQRTVHECAERLAVHERSHLAQLRALAERPVQ